MFCNHISSCLCVWLNVCVSVLETQIGTICTVYSQHAIRPRILTESHNTGLFFPPVWSLHSSLRGCNHSYRQHVHQLGLHRNATVKREGSKMAATRMGDYHSEPLSLHTVSSSDSSLYEIDSASLAEGFSLSFPK